MSEQIINATNALTESINGAKEGVTNSLNDFSSGAVVNANSEFLDSNGMIAKFVFLIMVLLAFLAFLYLGIQLIAYFTQPSGSPYLVYGLLPGTTGVTITQDPNKTGSVTLLRSNNAATGIEFSWSVWLFIDALKADNAMGTGGNLGTLHHTIFVKGEGKPSKSYPVGIYQPNNGPGVYVKRDVKTDASVANTNKLVILMDTISEASSVPLQTTVASNTPEPLKGTQNEVFDISNIPIDKWFHLVIRCTNIYIDVYINGIIVQRHQLKNAPRQNSNNVNICTNGGFGGNLSNLQYFNYALNSVQINSIFSSGPNLSPSQFMNNTKIASPQYLSSNWYNY